MIALSKMFKQPVRAIPGPEKILYLTFDDGPAPSTKNVLEALRKLNVPATFFVVAANARGEAALLKDMQDRGHTIGNHSLDHSYGPFFHGRKSMHAWIRESEDVLSAVLGRPPVGFRPPAGVRTPELNWALNDLGIPLVLWKRRFYDTRRRWTAKEALKSLDRSGPGDIVLLHDRQNPERLPVFLETLKIYVESAREAGFEFRPLTRAACEAASGNGRPKTIKANETESERLES